MVIGGADEYVDRKDNQVADLTELIARKDWVAEPQETP
jgi:hypothetical protein